MLRTTRGPTLLTTGPSRTPVETTRRAWTLRAIALTVVVAVAAGLRLWRLDLTIFEVDEAALVRLAEDMLRFGRVPLSGPLFSAGIPSAPHFIYLLAPMLAVSRDPAFISGAIAVANLLGLIGTVWLGWRAFGPLAGVLAGAMYAVSPWAVFYARRIWQPDLTPPLAVLLFIALDLAVVDRRVWWAAATFPIVAVAALVHPSFATLAPLLLAPAVVLLRTRRWRLLLAGGGVACLTTIPYVVYQVRTRWVDVANLRYYSSLHTWIDLDSVRYAWGLATGLGVRNDTAIPRLDRAVPEVLLDVAAGLETALLVAAIAVGLLLVTRRVPRSGRHQRARLTGVLLWLLLPVALTMRHSLPLQAHYFLLLLPAPFVLIGAAAAWFVQQRGAPFVRTGQLVAASALAATLFLQGMTVVRTLQNVASHSDPCFGPLLPSVESAAQEMVDLGRPSAANRAALETRAFDGLPLAYVLRSHYSAVDLAGMGDVGLGPHMPAGPVWAPPETIQPLLTTHQTRDLRYSSGVRLLELGYSDRPPDQQLFLALTWLVEAQADSKHAFVWDVAVVDAAGTTAFKQSGTDHVLAQLQGQRVVSWLTLDPTQANVAVLSPGTYTLRLRLTDTWVPQSIPFADGQGQPLNDTLELGPVSIAPPSAECGH